jgi:hypothetical protein
MQRSQLAPLCVEASLEKGVLVGALIGLIVGGSALWMYLESRSFGYEKGDIAGLAALNPAGWFLTGLLLWVVAFPLYLASRAQLRAAGKQRVAALTAEGRYAPKPRSAAGPVAASLTALAVALLFASQGGGLSFVAGIDACDSTSVQGLVQSIVTKNGAEIGLSSFGEVAAETTSDRRVCRVQATSPSLPDGTVWLTFTVERHGTDQIFVEVRK